jgi:hypothetical protein
MTENLWDAELQMQVVESGLIVEFWGHPMQRYV